MTYAHIYDFGHDMYGNPTAHFTVWDDGKPVFRTKRRQQCGYDTDRSAGALTKARSIVSDKLSLASFEGRRSEGSITANFGLGSK